MEQWRIVIVLNLIITGIPSIQIIGGNTMAQKESFKPYYNWNTFNTLAGLLILLNFVSFKPYYNWNTFNTQIKNKYDFN